jgi:5-methylcytosine-specific restriction enzyme subunit McrC
MTSEHRPYEVAEWKDCFIDKASLSAQDQRLARQLGGEAGRVEIEELKDRVRVRARSWIGVLRFEQFEVHIKPKLAGNYLNLIDLLTYTTGFHGLRRNIGQRFLEAKPNGGLFDLIVHLFVIACEALVNGGLLFDYVTEEGPLPVLRGRILVREQFNRHSGRIDLLECRYDEHSTNIIENQILAYALKMCARYISDAQIHLAVNRLAAVFDALCERSTLDLDDARNLTYHRLNQHYQEAHQLAWILLDGLGIKDLYTIRELRSFAFLIDMDKVFERFVWKIVNQALERTTLQVHYQKHDRSILWNTLTNKPYASIIPDLLVQSSLYPQRRLVIDAKYKRYNSQKITPGDIYQNFLYAYAYSDPAQAQPTALMIHPAEGKTAVHTHLHVKIGTGTGGATIYALGLEIPIALALAREKHGDELRQLLFGEIPEYSTLNEKLINNNI